MIAPPSIPSTSGFGPVNFGQDALEKVDPTAGPKSKVTSGDAQFDGAPVTVDPRYTTEDQRVADETRMAGQTSPMPLEEQIRQGLDQEQMGALLEQCNNGQLSINDLAAELMIIMLNNAMENKTIERKMRAELAQVQFQNGMKIADLMKAKGELAFKAAVTQAATQLASCIGNLVTSKLVEKALTPKNKSHDEAGLGDEGTLESTKIGPTEAERKAAREAGQIAGNLVGKVIESAGAIVVAECNLGISKIDAEIKTQEALGQLVDSIARSVQSSITSQEQAMQFAINLVEKLYSLAHQSLSSITNNIR
ncbi:MAG: hypothetical protein LBG09_03445 [Puniceicoccales bacterium]|jgi:hypothetical protein|nr:hypothetical protein [Puniceicoccales bacterium]